MLSQPAPVRDCVPIVIWTNGWARPLLPLISVRGALGGPVIWMLAHPSHSVSTVHMERENQICPNGRSNKCRRRNTSSSA